MIHRVDVLPLTSVDPAGRTAAAKLASAGLPAVGVTSLRVYLLETDASESDLASHALPLLADPITERAMLNTDPLPKAAARVEVHLKPGVMDPVAGSTLEALKLTGIDCREVRTARAFVLADEVEKGALKDAAKVLGNSVIEQIHLERHVPEAFAEPVVRPFELRHVKLLDLDDAALNKLSREGHLFLSLDEMQAVQNHFKTLGREPTDCELETLAQTWSEHCVHKTLKSGVIVKDAAGQEVRRYDNLIKQTIFAATQKLIAADTTSFCLSVFKDNAGVITFDETDAVCFKVETHNRPSAIEPYGGAATGTGGVVRDVLGTGLAAKPIANTDVFCVAYPDAGSGDGERHSQLEKLPPGVLHPKRILENVVAGVRDYGNRMGIPTVNGAVYFDDRYVANPLVFCGCVGLLPKDKVEKEVMPGDLIVVVGGRTGRDGIHGATFSSAELTDTHADEFSHAVQIGNAITEKKVADVILQARDHKEGTLFIALTDCGAGGLSSAIGEMGSEIGADVELKDVTLKYPGLRYDEIWISEAQERMVLSVPPGKVQTLLDLAAAEDVEATVIGTFGTADKELIVRYEGTIVAQMSMHFVHDGIPMPMRDATAFPAELADARPTMEGPSDLRERLLKTLAHPNIASKHWIIRQYDHEVQGGSVIKPLIGPLQIGPADAAVVRPKISGTRGVAISCGMAPSVEAPYAMVVSAIDEAVRNAVCVGADLKRLALLDNFCWPKVDTADRMGTLVAACEACHDVSLAWGTPFISGKDSLSNQFTDQSTGEVIRIPRTMLISAIAIVEDIHRCVTSDLKSAGNLLLRLSPGRDGGTLAEQLQHRYAIHTAAAELIAKGYVRTAHDVSDGGWLTAAAEMAIGGNLGLQINVDDQPFAEVDTTYLLEVSPTDHAAAVALATQHGATLEVLGEVKESPTLQLTSADKTETVIDVADLTTAWRGTLDW